MLYISILERMLYISILELIVPSFNKKMMKEKQVLKLDPKNLIVLYGLYRGYVEDRINKTWYPGIT